MCKHNPKSGNKRFDHCIRELISNLRYLINNKKGKLVGSCCGHGKYPLTIVVEWSNLSRQEIVSGVMIPRRKKSYKRDKENYYYIPEVVEKIKQ